VATVVAALPTTGAKASVKKKRDWDRKEATRIVRFIGKPFLCKQYVGTLFKRTKASTRYLQRPFATSRKSVNS
jgi:hypothetical protein